MDEGVTRMGGSTRNGRRGGQGREYGKNSSN